MLRPPAVLLLVLGLVACGFEPGDHAAGLGGSSDAVAGRGEADGARGEGPDAMTVGGAPDAELAPPSPDAPVASPYDAPRADALDFSCRRDRDCPRDFRCKSERCEWSGGGGGHSGPGPGGD